jgi:hypothetical protein
MNKLEPHDSIISDKALNLRACANNVTTADSRISDQPGHVDRSAQHNCAISGKHITTEQMTTYLHGVAAESIDEIEGLIKHLKDLQENLAAHRARVERGTMQFLELNKSIGTLTNIISDSAAQVDTTAPAVQLQGTFVEP